MLCLLPLFRPIQMTAQGKTPRRLGGGLQQLSYFTVFLQDERLRDERVLTNEMNCGGYGLEFIPGRIHCRGAPQVSRLKTKSSGTSTGGRVRQKAGQLVTGLYTPRKSWITPRSAPTTLPFRVEYGWLVFTSRQRPYLDFFFFRYGDN